ncbi:MAG: cobalamin B12-binding domain-containing protein [Verrucomicrobiales bacterium]|nr:cobalamin B12-binding domain-containing protein [Verrucomicrobiales bacterium]
MGDADFCRVLPAGLDASRAANGRVKIMAFPPLGIQTLAPVLRQAGHEVRLFDTAHPQMKAEDIARAVAQEPPDVIALSFLSTTTYPAAKGMARRLKAEAPQVPIIVGGPFATLNAVHILRDCPDMDAVGVGEGGTAADYWHTLRIGAVAGLVWRSHGGVKRTPASLLRDLDRFPIGCASLPISYIESLPLDVPAVLSLDKFCTVRTSRGCPYACSCCIPAQARAVAEPLVSARTGELQELHDRGTARSTSPTTTF